jgi:hypothetical protein
VKSSCEQNVSEGKKKGKKRKGEHHLLLLARASLSGFSGAFYGVSNIVPL